MKKIFTFFLALVASAGTIFAWDYEQVSIGDLYYNLDATTKTAQVTYKSYSNLTYNEGWNVTTANIPSSVKYNSVTYSVTSIGDDAFYDCYSLNSVTIPNSVTSIGRYAFQACYGLDSINIPNSVTDIGYRAFGECGLRVVTLPENITSIPGDAFTWCTRLTSITIPNGVTSIGESAFYWCTGLTSITIPNSITSIGKDAFYACPELKEIRYNGSLDDWYSKSWKPLSISSSYSLYINDALITDITIPNNITNIAENLFEGCTSLNSVTIPNGITSIAGNAFYGCSGLRYVELQAETPIGLHCETYEYSGETYTYCIYPFPDGCDIYVPCGSIDAYINADSWSEHSSNIKYAPTTYNISTIAENGIINVPYCSVCDESVEVTAVPNEGYYFSQWSDGSTDNPRTFELLSDITIEAVFAHNPVITYKYNANFGYVTGDTVTPTGLAVDNITFEAHAYKAFYFVRWADGNTENPRTIELSQDTTMEAIFDYLLSGKCGKDSALTWTFEPASMALNITGKGALSENYTYGTFIESLTIGNEVSTIGQSAFYGCNNLKNVIIGSSVKVLEEGAFYGCSATETITCYGQRPPTVNQNALYGLDYSTIVYVPADYLETYKMHNAWGLYDVRPLGAKSTETTDVNVTPAETTADVAWPAISGAATYELVIKDKSGNVICTLVFNANGQLTSIAFAPSRNGAPQQTQAAGFSFTVTGLENGTSYDLTITSKDNNGGTLDTKTISFTTTGATAIDELLSDQVQCTKVMRNGQIFILRGDKTYTLTGQETIMP